MVIDNNVFEIYLILTETDPKNWTNTIKLSSFTTNYKKKIRVSCDALFN